jgi:hypothetical protein
MGPKLLFVTGIILAHGALAAGWLAQEAPRHRAALVSTCTRLPSQPMHIAPPRELLAYVVTPANVENEVLRP